MDKNIGKIIIKNVRSKYSQKSLDDAKKSAADALKTALERAIQKTAEATGDLIGNKIAYKIRKFSKFSPQNNSETVEHDKVLPEERYIFPEKDKKLLMI